MFRNIAGMEIGRGLRRFSTVELTALVAKFGPTGTAQVNAIAPGTLVWDVTTVSVKVFNGTDFVALA